MRFLNPLKRVLAVSFDANLNSWESTRLQKRLFGIFVYLTDIQLYIRILAVVN